MIPTREEQAYRGRIDKLEAENAELRRLLSEARQYVLDTVGEEDMEVQTHSAALLKDIDAALSE